jgi:hypothetical protein
VDILKPKLNLAAFLIYPLLLPVALTIQENTGYDALSSSPEEFVKKVFVPAIFMVAEKDHISPPEKVQTLFNDYGSDKKKLHVMKGREHSDTRLEDDLSVGCHYLKKLYSAHVAQKAKHSNKKRRNRMIQIWSNKTLETPEGALSKPEDSLAIPSEFEVSPSRKNSTRYRSESKLNHVFPLPRSRIKSISKLSWKGDKETDVVSPFYGINIPKSTKYNSSFEGSKKSTQARSLTLTKLDDSQTSENLDGHEVNVLKSDKLMQNGLNSLRLRNGVKFPQD